MKYVLSKEHFSYKILTLLMESSVYPRPLYGQPPPHIYMKILILPSMIFQKSQTPINKDGHTMKNHFSPFIKNENQKRRIICSFKKGLIGNKRKCNNLLYSLHETSLKKSNA